jgi:hypothetical protein
MISGFWVKNDRYQTFSDKEMVYSDEPVSVARIEMPG